MVTVTCGRKRRIWMLNPFLLLHLKQTLFAADTIHFMMRSAIVTYMITVFESVMHFSFIHFFVHSQENHLHHPYFL